MTRKEPSRPGVPAAPAEFMHQLERERFVAGVNDDLRLFAAQHNGLALWRAYVSCRARGEPIPEVILKCFDGLAARLQTADSADEIAQALWLASEKGGESPRRWLARLDKKRQVVSAVERLLRLHGANPKASKKLVYARVAEDMGLSPAEVKKAHQRWSSEGSPPSRPSRKVRSVFDLGQTPQD